MARSRMIRPEFFDDEKLSRLSRDSRLTFVGLWTLSDDYGIVKAHPTWLKNHIFPYDDLSISEFQSWLDSLIRERMLVPLKYHNEVFFHIKHFLKHQRVNHPSQTRNIPADVDLSTLLIKIQEGSRETQEDSREIQEGSRFPLSETETETETEDDFSEEKSRPAGSVANTQKEKKTRKHFSEVVGEYVDSIRTSSEALMKKSNGKKFNPYQWVQHKLKNQGHPKAVDESLSGLLVMMETQKITEPWAYADAIFKTKNQNINENEALKEHAMTKKDLAKLADQICEGLGLRF
jgi:hypothetical protein